MPRPAKGQVLVLDRERGRVFALRFHAYGKRRYVTTTATSREKAETELRHVLADVDRGIWQPPKSDEPEAPREEELTFHEFASQWLADRKEDGLAARTIEDYEWALTRHLLPFFASYRLSEITKQDVDTYKTYKATEGVLGNNQVNKTLTRLSQVLALAQEYDYIAGNPAAGKRRRLPRTKPRRAYVELEQLPTLLESAEGLLAGRGRPLLATLAGAGLRVSEALALERRNVNIARGTLTVERSKTDAGERTIDLTPALREELAIWLDRSPFREQSDLVFATTTGKPDNRNNVRNRLLVRAIKKANQKLSELGIEPIGQVAPHGLRRTYAGLRHAVGDDVAYTSEQLGHEDPTFTLKVYVHAAKRRGRLTEAERKEFDRAVEWAEWALLGTTGAVARPTVARAENDGRRKSAAGAESV